MIKRFDFLALYTISYLAFIYLPVLVIPLFSFNDSIYIAFPLKGFTLQWYDNLFNGSPGLIEALGNSVRVAGLVSVISTAFGLLAAKAVTRYYMPGKGAIVSFILTPLVIPELWWVLPCSCCSTTRGSSSHYSPSAWVTCSCVYRLRWWS